MGVSLKKAVKREKETDNVKEFRIWYYVELSTLLFIEKSYFIFFDWSSFAETGFKNRSWSEIGKKSIIREGYSYKKLHLLALLGKNEVEFYQFTLRRLTAPLIFDFLQKSLENLIKKYQQLNLRLIVILDNSPLNHSRAIKNFCWLLRDCSSLHYTLLLFSKSN